jgi:hypothetical protein
MEDGNVKGVIRGGGEEQKALVCLQSFSADPWTAYCVQRWWPAASFQAEIEYEQKKSMGILKLRRRLKESAEEAGYYI